MAVQPVALTNSESIDLRKRVEHALDGAVAEFLRSTVIRDGNGVPLGGPDPRAVDVELRLYLARRLAREGLDLTGAAAFEAKIAQLEAELGVK